MPKHGLLVAVAIVTLGIVERAPAQVYPTRQIAVVVPFAAGGATDVTARIIAERMRKSLGQPIIIENVTGAGGSLAVGRVARAAPDGYTLISGHWGTMVVNGATYELPYDVRSAFEPIARTANGSNLIVAKKTVSASDLKEFIAWLKAHPDKALMGTVGGGSASHLWGILFQNITGTRFQFVPYRGIAPSMQDLVAGQIDMMITSASDSLPQVAAGTIKAYAVADKRRLAVAPDIPTVDEAGLPDFDAQMWHGLWAPARTPMDVIAKLNAAVVDALGDPGVRARLAEIGEDIPSPGERTPEALAAHHKAEIEKWWPIIKAAGIRTE
jgi:tripartite-type tricarboxylate transporter receptor subunit TctC